MNLVTAVDSDMRNASNVFQAEWVIRGAGSQGWAKPYFPSWEAERIANESPDSFRWNMSLMGPEGEPGNWEYLSEEEWLPVEFVEDHGVGKWAMAPNWEWREVNEPQHMPYEPESWDRVAEFKGLEIQVNRAVDNHCNLMVSDMAYKTVVG